MFLTKFASKVKLIHRRDSLRAEKMLQKKLMENKKIEIIWDSVVEEVFGDSEPKNVKGIKIKNLKTNEITGNQTRWFVYCNWSRSSHTAHLKIN